MQITHSGSMPRSFNLLIFVVVYCLEVALELVTTTESPLLCSNKFGKYCTKLLRAAIIESELLSLLLYLAFPHHHHCCCCCFYIHIRPEQEALLKPHNCHIFVNTL
jgi:hypothetical protein